jgi:predicted transcriptional regulator
VAQPAVARIESGAVVPRVDTLDRLLAACASVDDLIRMTLAAARPKDLIEAEILGALREEIEARESTEKRGGRGGA